MSKFGSDAKDLKLYFSPYALGYCVFKLDGKGLGEAAKEQFMEAGVLAENIIDPKVDTVSNDNFPSNSSGDDSVRFAVVAGLS